MEENDLQNSETVAVSDLEKNSISIQAVIHLLKWSGLAWKENQKDQDGQKM